jgi:hypothetical protein
MNNPPRTPGQVAREVWCNSTTNDSAAHWEEIAAAVLSDMHARIDAAGTVCGNALVELVAAQRRIAKLEGVLTKVLAFLEHRFGNEDGDDWHDTAAGDIADLISSTI